MDLYTGLILLLLSVRQCLAHPTTIAPPLNDYPHVAIRNDAVFGGVPGVHLFKRRDQCDQSQFFCPTGSCFTDPANGYVGCCSVASCAPRTSCIEYDPSINRPCDPDTGGCLYCSDPANPHCFTITNEGAHQWIQYCATKASTETLNYRNLITTGSQWSSSISTTSTAATTSSASAGSTAISGASPAAKTSLPAATSISAEGAANTASSSAAGVAAVPGDGQQGANSSGGSPTKALVGGAVGGAIAGLAVIVAAVWLSLRLYKSQRRHRNGSTTNDEKPVSSPESPPSIATVSPPAEAEGSTPREPSYYYSPSCFSRCEEADSRPVSMEAHPAVRPTYEKKNALGIEDIEVLSDTRLSRYTVSNPDLPSATSEHPSILRPGKAGPTTPVSPQLAFPCVSEIAATPSSVQRSPAAPTYGLSFPYTPSHYAAEPPGSIPRTFAAVPPNVVQQYSTVTLPQNSSTATLASRSAGLYRGLSRRSGDAMPPWAYLSPEHAVNGGWRNEPESPNEKG